MVKLPQGVLQGLVIDEPWIGMLLAGKKTWEMRSAPTSKRGTIGLIRKRIRTCGWHSQPCRLASPTQR